MRYAGQDGDPVKPPGPTTCSRARSLLVLLAALRTSQCVVKAYPIPAEDVEDEDDVSSDPMEKLIPLT